MELDQAVTNIRQAANPNQGQPQQTSDQLLQRLRQFQLQNLEAQGQGIQQTNQQLAALGKQAATQTGMKDPVMWAALADMMAPNKDSNLTPLAMQLKKRDTSADQRYKLQQQLSRQQQNLSSSANDLLGALDPTELEVLAHKSKYAKDLAKEKSKLRKGETKEEYDLRKSLEGTKSGYRKDEAVQDYDLKTDLEGTKSGYRKDETSHLYDEKSQLAEQEHGYDLELYDRKEKDWYKRFAEEQKGKKSVGVEALDREFGKEMEGWMGKGQDRVTVTNNMELLKKTLAELKAEGAPEYGRKFAPQALRAMGGKEQQKAIELEQNVGKVSIQTLKLLLGGSFSEKDREIAMGLEYDPRLSNEANARKLERAVKYFSEIIDEKNAAADYFRKNKTIDGYTGYRDVPTEEGGSDFYNNFINKRGL